MTSVKHTIFLCPINEFCLIHPNAKQELTTASCRQR